MILPYVYETVDLAYDVIDYLEAKMDKYKSLSIISVHEFINDLDVIQSFNKPNWMTEPELSYIDSKRGWNKKDFIVHARRVRWYGGSGYVLEFPEPINFE